MNLREQIKRIHAQHSTPEFHAFRGEAIHRMADDLAESFFNLLQRGYTSATGTQQEIWYLVDSVDLRAVIKARELLKSGDLTSDIPEVV